MELPKELLNENVEKDSIHVIQFSQFKDNDPATEEYIDNTLIKFDLLNNSVDKTS